MLRRRPWNLILNSFYLHLGTSPGIYLSVITTTTTTMDTANLIRYIIQTNPMQIYRTYLPFDVWKLRFLWGKWNTSKSRFVGTNLGASAQTLHTFRLGNSRPREGWSPMMQGWSPCLRKPPKNGRNTKKKTKNFTPNNFPCYQRDSNPYLGVSNTSKHTWLLSFRIEFHILSKQRLHQTPLNKCVIKP